MTHPHGTPFRFALTSLRMMTASLLVAGLAACGGGGSDDSATASAKTFKGTVTAYDSPQSFSVDGIPVDASAAPATLSVGMHVEVHGAVNNGVMVASQVKIEGAGSDDGENEDDEKDDGDGCDTVAKSRCPDEDSDDEGQDDDKDDVDEDDKDDDHPR